MAQLLKYLLIFLLFCGLDNSLCAQDGKTYPPLDVSASKEIWFDGIVGVENSGIINGDEYRASPRGSGTHSFFLPTEMTGLIHFKGQQFYVPLLFDVYRDVLVVKYRDANGGSNFIEPAKTNTEGFRILNREFRNFKDKGFCEVLVSDPALSLVSKRSKTMSMKSGAVSYEWDDKYFFVMKDHWIVLRNNASIGKIFTTKQHERLVKDFMRREKIKISRFNDDDLKKLVAYCIDIEKSRL